MVEYTKKKVGVKRQAIGVKYPLFGTLICYFYHMKTITTEIIIHSSINHVWQVLVNFENYHQWNPFIKKVKGELVPSAKLEVEIQLENNKPMIFKPIITALQEEKKLQWKGKLWMKGIFDGEHSFQLEKINETKTKMIHSESFKGILSGIIFRKIETDTLRGFKSMNEALKMYVENK